MQGMLYRTLGSTGEKISAIGIGDWHIGLPGVDEPLSIRIIRTAVDRGINFMDDCWDYNERAAPALVRKEPKALDISRTFFA
jgi:aryl-alcohol dehydrogenase-like predicted oxidoreductase